MKISGRITKTVKNGAWKYGASISISECVSESEADEALRDAISKVTGQQTLEEATKDTEDAKEAKEEDEEDGEDNENEGGDESGESGSAEGSSETGKEDSSEPKHRSSSSRKKTDTEG